MKRDASPTEEPREADTKERLRVACGWCSLLGFVGGVAVASINYFVTYADEDEQNLKGMFTALTLLAMGVLVPNPRVRGFAWLVVALYACYLLLTLLVTGR